MGLEPTDYAEAILQVCRLCTESQLPCVSGVTGANVKKRLRAILTGNIAPELTFGKKMLLTAIGLLTLVAPVSIGVLHTPQVQAQSPRAAAPPESARPLAARIAAPQRGRQAAQPVAAPPEFEVASVKAISDPHGWINPRMIDPQRFVGTDILPRLMEWAYGVRDFQILQAPQWARQQLFEIHATAERPSNESQIRQMLQALLADRFKLRLHRQTKEIPVYALMAGRNGPRLTAAKDASINQGAGDIEVGPAQLYARGTTMGMFVRILTENEERPVIDKTNLTGHYDFNLSWEQTSYGPGFTPIGAAIFGPIQDLGLKLAPQKDKVQMLVLDSVERPSEN